MPAIYEGAVQDLIDELGALPGIGPKSAQRIAFHILGADAADVNRLAQALTAVKAKSTFFVKLAKRFGGRAVQYLPRSAP